MEMDMVETRTGEEIRRFLLLEKEFSDFVLWNGQCIIGETNHFYIK